MPIRSIVTATLLTCATTAAAQAPAEDRALALARFHAVAESTAVHENWSGTAAVVGGVVVGAIFAGFFYHVTHRDAPSVNGTAGNVGGALVGASIGAAGGALFGAFVGSLIPKHKKT